jgi:lipopolysaccharide transport system permease protein
VTRSLELNRRLLKRLYFPRLLLPLAQLAPALVEFVIHCGLIVGVAVFLQLRDGQLHLSPGWHLMAAPAAVVAIVLFALGLGLWTSVWGINVRDVRFTLRYVMQFWFFATPVIYPLSLVPEDWRWLAAANPMAVLIETFKWGVLGVGAPDLPHLALALPLIAAILVAGFWYFAKFEAASVDRI